MGATMAHLCVLNFNLTKKELAMLHSPIDLAVSDPARNAQCLCSFPDPDEPMEVGVERHGRSDHHNPVRG